MRFQLHILNFLYCIYVQILTLLGDLKVLAKGCERKMGGFLKSSIINFLKLFDIKLSRHSKSRPRYLKIIQNRNINIIFDVGANDGQFALSVLEDGFQGKIVSFEPTSKAHMALCDNARNVQKWIIYERVAIGENNGSVNINIAGNSGASSSILDMRDQHKKSAPSSKYVSSETVDLVKLDSIYRNFFKEGEKCLIKIDVQGYEENVLSGATEFLSKVDCVKIECNLMSLYEGDRTYEYFFDFFEKRGFKLIDIDPGFSDPITGQLFQFDALFVRVS